ncbi:MAG: recombinase XerC [Betaproteobacteria bacterium RIFCSPLOWO2_02_FULL_62_17]|nr:MAG: recombinase XerC [Betaproteobacteria bacterium RIFCSPLOWO2_02_FULL_62_17]
MTTYNPDNERIKHRYFGFLKEAKRHGEAKVDAVAKSLDRFESYTRHREFKAFRIEQAIGFKRNMLNQKNQRSGEMLSKATLYATFADLKRFFQWLALEPGYRSRLGYSDAEYFNLSQNDTRIATAHREQSAPTLEQIKHVISKMSAESEIGRRNRAVVAFTLLTGARDGAIASMKLKHIDLDAACVYQDAREVRTKFRKTFRTYFFPVGDDIEKIVIEWVTYLRNLKLWGNDDPVFPATRVTTGTGLRFAVDGLKREHWRTAAPIRSIFRNAFVSTGLPYFNPHSFRNTLIRHGQVVCRNAEDFKAWSQNIGHEGVLTTFISYGDVSTERQREIVRGLGTSERTKQSSVDELADAIALRLRASGK